MQSDANDHYSPRTLTEALQYHATSRPGEPAFVDERGCLDFGELWDAARRRAVWMTRQGVRAGEVVAISLDPDPEGSRRAVELFYAAALLGVAILPLQPEVPLATCVELIERFGACWLVAVGAPVLVGGARSINPRGYEAVPGNFDPAQVLRGDLPEAPFFYCLTSGTSGEPKSMLYTHAQFHASSMAGARSVGMLADDRQMTAVGWPSNIGLRYMMRAHVAGAAYVAVRFSDSRVELAGILERYAVTRVTGSPWQIRRLLQSKAPPQGMPPLRSFHVTGAAITPEEIAAARAGITPNVCPGYGSNEVGALTLIGPGEDMPAGCVGPLLPEVEVKVDGEILERTSDGMRIGELAFRTPWMCHEYAANPAASKLHFRDGWFYPADVGGIDAQGRLWLRGRSMDVINWGGRKLWPDAIESVLKRHPAVADAAVAALPDPMAGQVPAAFVVARGTLTEQSLRAHCAAYLESSRIPPHIVVLEKIPRNANGKIMRQTLVIDYLPAIMENTLRRAGQAQA